MAVSAQEARIITNSSNLPEIPETNFVMKEIIPKIIKRSKEGYASTEIIWEFFDKKSRHFLVFMYNDVKLSIYGIYDLLESLDYKYDKLIGVYDNDIGINIKW